MSDDPITRAAELLAVHYVECSGLGEVTCRCREGGWMTPSAHRRHQAAVLAEAGLLRTDADGGCAVLSDSDRAELSKLREHLVYWDHDHGATTGEELRDQLADIVADADEPLSRPYHLVDRLLARINAYNREVDRTLYAVIPGDGWGIELDSETCGRVAARRAVQETDR